MTPDARRPLQDILDAIARARIADKRMQLASSLVDEVGVQLAFQAILYNLGVIADAVTAVPADVLELDPDTPWADVAAMTELIGPTYHRIVPADIHATIEAALDPLDSAVRRLKTRV